MGWIFNRLPDGGIEVDLGEEFRDVLRALPAQLEDVLREAPGDESLARLAPPAFTNQPEHEEEYRHFMGDDLRSHQLAALALLRSTSGAERLTEEQAQGWLSAINSLRLVLGTQLDVRDDEDLDDRLEGIDPTAGVEDLDPDVLAHAASVQIYQYLSMLLGDLVDALADGLPEVPAED